MLHARYPSPKQREVSIDDQLKACQDYCDREGIEIANVYHDNAMFGTNDNRLDFQCMIANVGKSDFIVG